MNRKLTLLLSFLAIYTSVLAQQSRLDREAYIKLHAPERSQSFNALVKGDISRIRLIVKQNGGTFRFSSGNIASVNIDPSILKALATDPSVQRIEAHTGKYQPLNDTMLYRNNVVPVHAGQAPLPQSYDGTGVVIGLIDTGIDFTHPDFQDSNGNSRIKYLWDQNLSTAANTPQPYNYGQEWDNLAIDSGAAAAHNDLANWGHGTHVTGIAAGDGSAVNHYKGVAPGADIIVVALNFNGYSQGVVDAVDYIFSKAQAMGKPCVINASVGDYYGSHDGLDLEAQLINNLVTAQNGRAMVAAVGNAGSIPFHLGYQVNSDTSFTWFSYNTSGPSLYIQLWADTANLNNVSFSIGADQPGPNWSFRGNVPFSTVASHLNVYVNDTLYNNGNRIGIVQTYGQLIGGTYSMEFNIIPDSTTYLWRLMTTGNGSFDVWNFDVVSSGLPTASAFPGIAYYKMPDTMQTMVSSFQCLDNVITVGNYSNRDRHLDYNNNLNIDTTITPGALFYTSSSGPTRDGRIKPDIAASGAYTISCAVLSMVPNFIANAPQVLAQGGYHVTGGGSSAASPIVAGIAALYLQANPNATYSQVKNAIISCARQDQFTGSNLPNNAWGYGKADAFQALVGCTTGTNESSINPSLLIYPNPSEGDIIIDLSMTSNEGTITLYNALGQAIRIYEITNSNSIRIDRKELDAGLYFCTFSVNGRILRTEKLVLL